MFQRDHAVYRILADRQTTQIRHVRAASELLAQIVNNRANVRAFGAMDFQLQFITFVANKQQFVHGNRSGFTRDLNTLTRVLVQLLP